MYLFKRLGDLFAGFVEADAQSSLYLLCISTIPHGYFILTISTKWHPKIYK